VAEQAIASPEGALQVVAPTLPPMEVPLLTKPMLTAPVGAAPLPVHESVADTATPAVDV
jgi:hypothetical protein